MSTSTFDRSNIQETPNPKPLSVQRVRVGTKVDGKDASDLHTSEYGFIRNAQLDPAAYIERREDDDE